jgi:4-amino-4-deoxy-L-arabinose transferase-like glycosyltransferase
LLALSCLIFLVAGLRDVTQPWEKGLRGVGGGGYTDGAVSQTLAYGLGVTLGTPAWITDDDGELIRSVNWHHPPGYWLFMSGCVWLLGHEPCVFRLVQLAIFLPGLLALFAFAKRRLGAPAAGLTTLLFTTNPLVAYFGPMVLHDGAVLSFGLLTLWSFDRHLLAPTARSWWRTAAFFFVTTSIDYPGYFWGLAMFALALIAPQRRRAIWSVFSFFPVSVLAFLVMALHYGLVLGGPLVFLEQLVGVFKDEAARVHPTPTGERVLAASRELLVAYGNWASFVLALLGCALALFSRRGSWRAIATLGLVLCVPGVCNEVAMFEHALDHVFWPLQGFAGVAALGAIVPVAGAHLRSSAVAASRRLGSVLIATTAGLALFGTVWTHVVIGRFAFVENGSIAIIEKALPHLRGCSTTLTSAPEVANVYFGHTRVWYSITTPEHLEAMLAFGRAIEGRGTIAFVVSPDYRNSPLTQLLDTKARAIVVDDIAVYRFRL